MPQMRAADDKSMGTASCPKAFRGFPIALLAAGLLALSFMGFSGFKVFG